MVLKILREKTMMTRRRDRFCRSHWRRLSSLIPEEQYELEALFALLTGNVAEGRIKREGLRVHSGITFSQAPANCS